MVVMFCLGGMMLSPEGRSHLVELGVDAAAPHYATLVC